jgi:hypothetical protein
MGGINHFAVWVAGVAHFMLGAAWYTAFARTWIDGIGKSEEQLHAAQGSSSLPLVIAVAVAVIVAYTLAALIPKLGRQTAANGIKVGVVLALALIGSTLAMNYAFESRPVSLWLINTGYMTVGMAIMGAIVGGWKKKSRP